MSITAATSTSQLTLTANQTNVHLTKVNGITHTTAPRNSFYVNFTTASAESLPGHTDYITANDYGVAESRFPTDWDKTWSRLMAAFTAESAAGEDDAVSRTRWTPLFGGFNGTVGSESAMTTASPGSTTTVSNGNLHIQLANDDITAVKSFFGLAASAKIANGALKNWMVAFHKNGSDAAADWYLRRVQANTDDTVSVAQPDGFGAEANSYVLLFPIKLDIDFEVNGAHLEIAAVNNMFKEMSALSADNSPFFGARRYTRTDNTTSYYSANALLATSAGVVYHMITNFARKLAVKVLRQLATYNGITYERFPAKSTELADNDTVIREHTAAAIMTVTVSDASPTNPVPINLITSDTTSIGRSALVFADDGKTSKNVMTSQPVNIKINPAADMLTYGEAMACRVNTPRSGAYTDTNIAFNLTVIAEDNAQLTTHYEADLETGAQSTYNVEGDGTGMSAAGVTYYRNHATLGLTDNAAMGYFATTPQNGLPSNLVNSTTLTEYDAAATAQARAGNPDNYSVNTAAPTAAAFVDAAAAANTLNVTITTDLKLRVKTDSATNAKTWEMTTLNGTALSADATGWFYDTSRAVWMKGVYTLVGTTLAVTTRANGNPGDIVYVTDADTVLTDTKAKEYDGLSLNAVGDGMKIALTATSSPTMDAFFQRHFAKGTSNPIADFSGKTYVLTQTISTQAWNARTQLLGATYKRGAYTYVEAASTPKGSLRLYKSGSSFKLLSVGRTATAGPYTFKMDGKLTGAGHEHNSESLYIGGVIAEGDQQKTLITVTMTSASADATATTAAQKLYGGVDGTSPADNTTVYTVSDVKYTSDDSATLADLDINNFNTSLWRAADVDNNDYSGTAMLPGIGAGDAAENTTAVTMIVRPQTVGTETTGISDQPTLAAQVTDAFGTAESLKNDANSSVKRYSSYGIMRNTAFEKFSEVSSEQPELTEAMKVDKTEIAVEGSESLASIYKKYGLSGATADLSAAQSAAATSALAITTTAGNPATKYMKREQAAASFTASKNRPSEGVDAYVPKGSALIGEQIPGAAAETNYAATLPAAWYTTGTANYSASLMNVPIVGEIYGDSEVRFSASSLTAESTATFVDADGDSVFSITFAATTGDTYGTYNTAALAATAIETHINSLLNNTDTNGDLAPKPSYVYFDELQGFTDLRFSVKSVSVATANVTLTLHAMPVQLFIAQTASYSYEDTRTVAYNTSLTIASATGVHGDYAPVTATSTVSRANWDNFSHAVKQKYADEYADAVATNNKNVNTVNEKQAIVNTFSSSEFKVTGQFEKLTYDGTVSKATYKLMVQNISLGTAPEPLSTKFMGKSSYKILTDASSAPAKVDFTAKGIAETGTAVGAGNTYGADGGDIGDLASMTTALAFVQLNGTAGSVDVSSYTSGTATYKSVTASDNVTRFINGGVKFYRKGGAKVDTEDEDNDNSTTDIIPADDAFNMYMEWTMDATAAAGRNTASSGSMLSFIDDVRFNSRFALEIAASDNTSFDNACVPWEYASNGDIPSTGNFTTWGATAKDLIKLSNKTFAAGSAFADITRGDLRIEGSVDANEDLTSVLEFGLKLDAADHTGMDNITISRVKFTGTSGAAVTVASDSSKNGTTRGLTLSSIELADAKMQLLKAASTHFLGGNVTVKNCTREAGTATADTDDTYLIELGAESITINNEGFDSETYSADARQLNTLTLSGNFVDGTDKFASIHCPATNTNKPKSGGDGSAGKPFEYQRSYPLRNLVVLNNTVRGGLSTNDAALNIVGAPLTMNISGNTFVNLVGKTETQANFGTKYRPWHAAAIRMAIPVVNTHTTANGTTSTARPSLTFDNNTFVDTVATPAYTAPMSAMAMMSFAAFDSTTNLFCYTPSTTSADGNSFRLHNGIGVFAEKSIEPKKTTVNVPTTVTTDTYNTSTQLKASTAPNSVSIIDTTSGNDAGFSATSPLFYLTSSYVRPLQLTNAYVGLSGAYTNANFDGAPASFHYALPAETANQKYVVTPTPAAGANPTGSVRFTPTVTVASTQASDPSVVSGTIVAATTSWTASPFASVNVHLITLAANATDGGAFKLNWVANAFINLMRSTDATNVVLTDRMAANVTIDVVLKPQPGEDPSILPLSATQHSDTKTLLWNKTDTFNSLTQLHIAANGYFTKDVIYVFSNIDATRVATYEADQDSGDKLGNVAGTSDWSLDMADDDMNLLVNLDTYTTNGSFASTAFNADLEKEKELYLSRLALLIVLFDGWLIKDIGNSTATDNGTTAWNVGTSKFEDLYFRNDAYTADKSDKLNPTPTTQGNHKTITLTANPLSVVRGNTTAETEIKWTKTYPSSTYAGSEYGVVSTKVMAIGASAQSIAIAEETENATHGNTLSVKFTGTAGYDNTDTPDTHRTHVNRKFRKLGDKYVADFELRVEGGSGADAVNARDALTFSVARADGSPTSATVARLSGADADDTKYGFLQTLRVSMDRADLKRDHTMLLNLSESTYSTPIGIWRATGVSIEMTFTALEASNLVEADGNALFANNIHDKIFCNNLVGGAPNESANKWIFATPELSETVLLQNFKLLKDAETRDDDTTSGLQYIDVSGATVKLYATFEADSGSALKQIMDKLPGASLKFSTSNLDANSFKYVSSYDVNGNPVYASYTPNASATPAEYTTTEATTAFGEAEWLVRNIDFTHGTTEVPDLDDNATMSRWYVTITAAVPDWLPKPKHVTADSNPSSDWTKTISRIAYSGNNAAVATIVAADMMTASFDALTTSADSSANNRTLFDNYITAPRAADGCTFKVSAKRVGDDTEAEKWATNSLRRYALNDVSYDGAAIDTTAHTTAGVQSTGTVQVKVIKPDGTHHSYVEATGPIDYSSGKLTLTSTYRDVEQMTYKTGKVPFAFRKVGDTMQLAVQQPVGVLKTHSKYGSGYVFRANSGALAEITSGFDLSGDALHKDELSNPVYVAMKLHMQLASGVYSTDFYKKGSNSTGNVQYPALVLLGTHFNKLRTTAEALTSNYTRAFTGSAVVGVRGAVSNIQPELTLHPLDARSYDIKMNTLELTLRNVMTSSAVTTEQCDITLNRYVPKFGNDEKIEIASHRDMSISDFVNTHRFVKAEAIKALWKYEVVINKYVGGAGTTTQRTRTTNDVVSSGKVPCAAGNGAPANTQAAFPADKFYNVYTVLDTNAFSATHDRAPAWNAGVPGYGDEIDATTKAPTGKDDDDTTTTKRPTGRTNVYWLSVGTPADGRADPAPGYNRLIMYARDDADDAASVTLNTN